MTQMYNIFKNAQVFFCDPLFAMYTTLFSFGGVIPSSSALFCAISASALNVNGSQQARSTKVFLFSNMLDLIKLSLNT
jgi:hypothetical protein